MGWLYGHDWDTPKKLKDHVRANFVAAQIAILDEGATAYGRRWWMLFQPTNADGSKGPKAIALYLLDKHGTWGYKDMDESCGPFYFDCPLRLLDKADPAESPTAQDWRAEVRKHAAEVAARKATAKTLKKGDTVMLREGIKPRGPYDIASLKPLRGYFGPVLYRLKATDIDTVMAKCPGGHNAMVPNNDPQFAWKCADCGYIYGKDVPA